MKNEALHNVLREADLKVTSTRMTLLKIFFDHDCALSYHDLEEKTNQSLDKVTVYRALKSFEEKGIVHQVLDYSGSVKYALCSTDCDSDHHHDQHLHFKCVQCDNTYCIDEVTISIPDLPKGYMVQNYDLLVKGICANCSLK